MSEGRDLQPGRRKLVRWSLIAVATVVLLALLGLLGLKLVFTPAKLRAMVVPRIESAVGRDVELSSVRLAVFPRIAIRLEEFTLSNPEGFDGGPALQLAALELRPRLLPLLRRQVDLREVRLVRPTIRFHVNAQGAHNFAGLGATEEAAGEPGEAVATPAAALAVGALTLDDGSLFYSDARTGRGALIDELDASLSAERAAGGPLEAQGRFEVRSIRLLAPALAEDTVSIPDLTMRYDLAFDAPGDSLVVRALAVELGAIELDGDGLARGFREEDLRYELSLRSGQVDLESVLATLPPGLRPERLDARGRVTVAVDAANGPDSRPRVDGRIDVADLSADYAGRDALLAEGAGSAAFSLDSLVVSSFRARLMGRPLDLRGSASNFEDPVLDLRISAELDLARAAELRPAPDRSVAGLASIDLQLAGPLKRPGRLNLTGPVQLSDIRYRSALMASPVRIEAGTLRFAARGLTVRALPITVGQSDLRVSLTGRDLLPVLFGETGGNPATVDFTVESNRFDMSEILADTTVGYGGLVAARLAGRRVEDRDPGLIAAERYGLPPLPPVRADGRVRIAEFLNPPTRARDVSFRVTAANGVLEVRELEGHVYGGRLNGELSLDLADGAAPHPLRYSFALSGGRANAFLSNWTRLGGVVEGALDFSLRGTTALDSTLLPVAEQVDASGRTTFRDGRFRDFPLVRRLVGFLKLEPGLFSSFQQLGGGYRIRDGAFHLDEWRLSAGGLNGSLGGAAGLGGRLDIRLGLQVPASTLRDAGLLQGGGLGDVLRSLTGRPESLNLAVGIGGTLSEPEFQLDAESLERQLRGGAEDLLKRLLEPPP